MLLNGYKEFQTDFLNFGLIFLIGLPDWSCYQE